MKVAVECKSPLLQKSLEIFLSRYLSSAKQCDIIVRDVECMNDERCFYISGNKTSDLVKPFSKSQLILALEKKYQNMAHKDLVEEMGVETTEEPSFDILQKRIELLTSEYQENILKAVRAFYEK
ncbi:hypothetical protein KJ877_05310 [bacterium]|nr:hypothetical protein [bacterium]MBU1990449.1 hypothetical protein [bacterium]